jgi:hypothetical protein
MLFKEYIGSWADSASDGDEEDDEVDEVDGNGTLNGASMWSAVEIYIPSSETVYQEYKRRDFLIKFQSIQNLKLEDHQLIKTIQLAHMAQVVQLVPIV